jgi:hypothetical protein
VSNFSNYWNDTWMDSSFPLSGEKWIYLVAGSRSLDSIEVHGGLWANVGETTKSVEERLSGMDYSRKAAGGEWVILNKWKVPIWFSDSMVHQELRKSEIVVWKNSANSEEFLFIGDQKNANLASLIIGEAIIKLMNSENEKIINSINSDRTALRKKLEQLSSKKEKLDGERPKPTDQFEVTNWKIVAQTEKAWKKTIKDEVLRVENLDPIEEIKSSFLFSYLLGFISVIVYIVLEPSTPVFLLVFLPISSLISSVAGFYKTKGRWKSLIDSLKEKL